MVQDGQRFANFVATVRNIIANNKDARTTHWSGLNAYSALGDKEFRARFSTTLKRQDTPVKASRPARRSLLQTLPAYKNWVAEGKVTSVKNQGGVSRLHLLDARHLRAVLPSTSTLGSQQCLADAKQSVPWLQLVATSYLQCLLGLSRPTLAVLAVPASRCFFLPQ